MQTKTFATDQYLALPENPGIYKFYNKESTVIYVGKAKNIKKRVASYFTKSNTDSRKTYKLVKEIHQIEIILVESEFDALLLENNLIKENQPRYNILLKDDKTFPSILITNDRFPKVYATRSIDKSRGEYFGPYSSVKAMNSVLTLIRKLYHIRTCKLNLSEENITKKKFKVCLEYHIGNCLGPCENLQTEENYNREIEQVRNILKGRTSIIAKSYKTQMSIAAEQMQYELAHDLKGKLDALENFQSKTLIVNQNIQHVDVCTYVQEDTDVYINYMQISNGKIVNSETVQMITKIDEHIEDVFKFALFDLRKKYHSRHKEILANLEINSWEGVEIITPQIGDKKKLIELSLRNALFYKKEKITKQSLPTNNEAVLQLQKDLNLSIEPNHIECFDNSNMQGTNPVASMVCFKKGKPSKKDYRKFNIKTVEGPDDFASMTEVVYRRYHRLKQEDATLPDLILIDGGKGQLNAATTALKSLNLYRKIPIIGIAKRLEEIYVPEDPYPIHLHKKSLGLKLLQQLRDEAHRFAITFHRQKRSKTAVQSKLSQIPGIGKITQSKIIKIFGSIKRLKETPEIELRSQLGNKVSDNIVKAIKKGLL